MMNYLQRPMCHSDDIVRHSSVQGSPIVTSAYVRMCPADMWMNCAFYDISITFGTHLNFIIIQIFWYMTISDFALESVFFKITGVNKSVVFLSSVGCLGRPSQIYYFWPFPTLTSAIVKMAAAKTNDPISHDLRHLEQYFCFQNIGIWTADFRVLKDFAFFLRWPSYPPFYQMTAIKTNLCLYLWNAWDCVKM